MDLSIKRPVVFEFLDFSAFLRAYYAYRKSVDSSFSYDAWSQELGFKSKSFLRLVVIGKKKPSVGFLDAFSDTVFEARADKEYFLNLFKYTVEPAKEKKDLYMTNMLQQIRFHLNEKVIANQPQFVLSPLLPRLFAILSFKDIRATSTFCAHILAVSEDEIKKSLESLEQLKLIESVAIDGQVVWVASSEVFHVPEDLGSAQLMRYHERSLLEAIDAFSKPANLRKYKTMLIPLNENEIQEFNRALDNFMTEQMLKYNASELRGRRMFQSNLNFYAVSDDLS